MISILIYANVIFISTSLPATIFLGLCVGGRKTALSNQIINILTIFSMVGLAKAVDKKETEMSNGCIF